ncbi:MAG: hypothetical protein N2318_05140 [Meiothermus sp.]|nr:hypothetical protein [Meiothermus sp.]
MDILIYSISLVVGYSGWLVLFSDSFSSDLKPKAIPQVGNAGQLLFLVFTFLVLGQTTIFAASIGSIKPFEGQYPLLLPVLDANRSIDLMEFLLHYVRLLFLEEIPRIGMCLLILYLLRNTVSLKVNLGVALFFSTLWFTIIHDYGIVLLTQTAFVGTSLTLIGLRHGLAVSTLFHTLLNHFKLGLFFPYLSLMFTTLLMLTLNFLILTALWRYLLASVHVGEE